MFSKKLEDLSNGSFENKKGFFKRIKLRKLLLIILIIVAIGGVTASVFYYKQYQLLKTNPNLETQKETENLVAALNKIMELPTDETPTVATISNKDKLKEQVFFAKAENGDKLLAYTKAMQAILYRPSSNKIIAVAPIVINNNEKATSTPESEQK